MVDPDATIVIDSFTMSGWMSQWFCARFPGEIQPNQRYDRMFELMDCYGEHVERPAEIRPALERALRVGKTALVNIVGDRTIGIRALAEICSARPAYRTSTKLIGPGLALIRCGGHFEGRQVLHDANLASGNGALFTRDIIAIVADRKWVSFMYSYPNLIPLPERIRNGR